MKRITKILVMAAILLAIISLTSVVRASTDDLVNYVRSVHNINSMLWELPNEQKDAAENFIRKYLDDATADAVLAELRKAEDELIKTQATNHNDISKSVYSKAVAYVQSAVAKTGKASITVNTQKRTYSITTPDGQFGGLAEKLVTDPGTNNGNGGSSNAASTTSGKTLLYTGANYIAYVLAFVAIVAVAVVAKKRA